MKKSGFGLWKYLQYKKMIFINIISTYDEDFCVHFWLHYITYISAYTYNMPNSTHKVLS